MNTSISIDITSTQLHKFIQSYRQANPQIEDVETLVDSAIQKRWPSANPYEVAYAAVLNQANEDLDKIVRDAARKTEEWIDTTVQGDLFSTLPPVRIPKWLIDQNGNRKEYWKASPEDVLVFLETRATGLEAEITVLEEALATKKAQINALRAEMAKHRQVIDIAKQNGLDPKQVSYARQ